MAFLNLKETKIASKGEVPKIIFSRYYNTPATQETSSTQFLVMVLQTFTKILYFLR